MVYFVELWPVEGDEGDTVRFRASWGRVGAKAQACEKVVSWREVERQIAEKVRKGYRPVDLHRPPVELVDAQAADGAGSGAQKPAVLLDPRVAQLVDWVFREAGEHIQSFLAVEVGALSQGQIAEGRRLLSQAQSYFADYRRNPSG